MRTADGIARLRGRVPFKFLKCPGVAVVDPDAVQRHIGRADHGIGTGDLDLSDEDINRLLDERTSIMKELEMK